ncbi:DUF6881 domain-containing protein [Pseudoduganella chitinolytica]|uniref:DUF6881 domain-containing protein n=1 Tax=Pseudoduganella chitinolytica TaxID=34070 RepID=A0ABY8BGU2_9BURK|nr:hypothetical protein [Pseudoduganella chitinolytica]WEF35147.1 hypothetical protein PX653_10395 [Pseudoduganella chitinolytica]
MRYIKVTWNHQHPDEPHLIYQEVNNDSQETRKVELLKDGSLLGYASGSAEIGASTLADQLIPSIEEIKESDEFDAEPITQDEFEKVWNWATSASMH